MHENWGIHIVGSKVVLVPYQARHVPKYHGWMAGDGELLRLTGSEPLTLEQEYQMQETWHRSQDKCTFIVLCRTKLGDGGSGPDDQPDPSAEVEAMVGDTNLFLRQKSDDDEEDGEGSKVVAAEAEIMIAEKWARRQGLGREAVTLMLRYGAESLGVRSFEAKVKTDNEASLRMFQELGFVEQSRSSIFDEITLALDSERLLPREASGGLDIRPYHHHHHHHEPEDQGHRKSIQMTDEG